MRPFARARSLMSVLAAAITAYSSNGTAAARADLDLARLNAGSYESRGKGGKRAHRPTGIAGVRRAACKARNVKANRRAQR